MQLTAKAYASLPLTLLMDVGVINACQYFILRLNVKLADFSHLAARGIELGAPISDWMSGVFFFGPEISPSATFQVTNFVRFG